jgi:hypothetical protein
MYLIAACLLGSYAYKVRVFIWGPEPALGGLYSFSSGAILMSQVAPNSAAARAGLQNGDRILAIDGRPVRGQADWDVLRVNFEIGRAYPMQVEREGKRLETTLTLQRRSLNRMRPVDLVSMSVDMADALIILLLALFVGFTRPRDPVVRLGALALGLIGSDVFNVITGWAAMLRKLPLVLASWSGGPAWRFSCSRHCSSLFAQSFPARCSVPAGYGRWHWRRTFGFLLLSPPSFGSRLSILGSRYRMPDGFWDRTLVHAWAAASFSRTSSRGWSVSC